jgi:hypothetical protein
MSNYNYEGPSDGDWDERGDLSWKEYDWQQYLRRHEQEIEKFIECYNQLKDQPEHIDEVAHQMGWDAEDWSVADNGYDDDPTAELERLRDEEEDIQEDFDPYTLLRHPVFVVVRGLNRHLRRMWELYQRRHEATLTPAASWRFANALNEGEMAATLAIQALDMGDYALAVCQIKLALSSINRTFEMLPGLLDPHSVDGCLLAREFRIRLFDLREVCLRVMNDCRAEIRRQGRESE